MDDTKMPQPRTLAEVQAELECIEEIASVGSYTWDFTNGAIVWSKQMFVLLGYVPDSIVPSIEAFRSALPPEEAEAVMQRLQADVARGDATPFVYRVRGPDQKTRYLRSSARFERNAAGLVVRMQGALRDVTETVSSERSLRESNALLAFAQELAHIGTWVFDLASGVLTWSDELYRIHGFAPGAFAPTSDTAPSLVHEADRHVLQRIATELTTFHRTASLQYRIVRPSGEERTVLACAAVQDEAPGSAGRIIGTVLDVTEVRHLEGMLAHAQRMEAIGRLAGGIAHDFNNLLASIVLSLTLVRRHTPETPGPALTGLADIEEAAARATALTRQLLAFARRQPIEPRVVHLDEIARNLHGLLRRLAGPQIETAIASAPGLWTIKADPSQVEQILVNLVVNARDAMLGDAGRVEVALRNVDIDEDHVLAHPDATVGPHVLLEVTDTGAGMDASTLDHIFEPFFTTKPAGHGTGLGLATCYGIVRQAGGHIVVESATGRGSSFRVFFPRSFEAATPTAMPEGPIEPSRGETVLVVDDDDAVRRATVQLLDEAGYVVVEASSGVEALATMNGEVRFALLVTDVVMQPLDGIALAKVVRERFRDVRVLLISGYIPGTGRGYDPRPDDLPLLSKPFTPRALLARVRAVLDGPKVGAS